MTNKKPICFVLSPIGEKGSETRRRADQVFEHVISPVAKRFKLQALRADHLSEPGLITSQVIQHITEDRLVIADLTGANPNVYYELAIRHAVRKPFVQIINKDEKPPFDVALMRFIVVDITDPDNLKTAKIEMIKHVETALHKEAADIDSPISVAIDMQALRSSESRQERALLRVTEFTDDLRTHLRSVESSLIAIHNFFSAVGPPRDSSNLRGLMRRFENLMVSAQNGKYSSYEFERLREELFRELGSDGSTERAFHQMQLATQLLHRP